MITLDEPRTAGASSVLFECIAGSRAYGTSTTASDEDIRGIFAVPATSYMDLARDHWAFSPKPSRREPRSKWGQRLPECANTGFG